MRALAIVPALLIPVFSAIGSCANSIQQAQAASASASVEPSGNDCAVMAAVATEHYKLSAENPSPPLKSMGDAGWRPRCDWSKYGLAFTDYNDVPPTADPRERLKWVEFKQPKYDGQGATIETGIMHGPLAGIGYECRVRSSVAGWTTGECKQTWIS